MSEARSSGAPDGSEAPAGWYEHPQSRQVQWWDGRQWLPPTAHAEWSRTQRRAVPADVIPGDGVFLVNSEIAPGTYMSEENVGCYWARLSGTEGTLAEIIANDNVDGRALVTIAPTDVAFESNRCAGWVRVE